MTSDKIPGLEASAGTKKICHCCLPQASNLEKGFSLKCMGGGEDVGFWKDYHLKIVLAANHVVRRGGGAVEGSSQALGEGW